MSTTPKPGTIGALPDIVDVLDTSLLEVEHESEGSVKITFETLKAFILFARYSNSDIDLALTGKVDNQELNDAIDILNQAIGTKASSSDVNDALDDLTNAVNEKANASSVYTKAETDKVGERFPNYSLPVVTTAGACNLALANLFTINAGTRTISFTNLPSNRSFTVVLKLMANGTTTWPSNINWVEGAAPVLGATTTIVTINYHSGTWTGNVYNAV